MHVQTALSELRELQRVTRSSEGIVAEGIDDKLEGKGGRHIWSKCTICTYEILNQFFKFAKKKPQKQPKHPTVELMKKL